MHPLQTSLSLFSILQENRDFPLLPNNISQLICVITKNANCQQVLACNFDFEARTLSRLNECQKICHFSLTLNSTPRRSYDKKNAATRTGDSVKFCIIYLIGKFHQFYPTYFKFHPTLYPTYLHFLPYFYRTLNAFYRTITEFLPNYCSSSSKSILGCWDSRYCFILSELTTFFPVCSSKASFATLATDPPLAATCACSLIV